MRTLLIIFFTLFVLSTSAQNNMMFLELGGNGGLTSINYERQLTNASGLSVRVGFGATLFEFKNDELDNLDTTGCAFCGVRVPAPKVSLTIPLSMQYLFDLRNNNYLETGLGSTWQLSEKSLLVHHVSVGFRRYFGSTGKWMWKVNFTPILGVSGQNSFKDSEPTIWGGFSIGKRF